MTEFFRQLFLTCGSGHGIGLRLVVTRKQKGMLVELLRTPHGSHLYGLATPTSDLDYFIVTTNRIGRVRARNAKQTIKGAEDLLKTDLSTFMQYAEKGVPQYLEAMWSQMATVDRIHDMRFAYRPNPYQVEKTYVRTIRNFWLADDFKRRRHAWRLWLNLLQLKEEGTFNPSLSHADAERITGYANKQTPPPINLTPSGYVYPS